MGHPVKPCNRWYAYYTKSAEIYHLGSLIPSPGVVLRGLHHPHGLLLGEAARGLHGDVLSDAERLDGDLRVVGWRAGNHDEVDILAQEDVVDSRRRIRDVEILGDGLRLLSGEAPDGLDAKPL